MCESRKKFIWFGAAVGVSKASPQPGPPIYVRIDSIGTKNKRKRDGNSNRIRRLMRTQFATNATALGRNRAENERCEYEWKVHVFDRNEAKSTAPPAREECKKC